MKKAMILSLSAVVLLSGCGSYASSGAYAGASFGSVIGSAIGGISGGPRGSDIGTLVGMAGGAMVGGVLGAQADSKQQAYQAYEDEKFERKYRQHRSAATQGNSGGYYGGNYDESTFDPEGRGDDVLYDFNSTDYTGNYTATHAEDVTPSVRYDEIATSQRKSAYPLEVRNVRFVDDNQDRRISAGEISKVIFEVYNTSSEPVFDVQPMVVDASGNKQISISNTIHVERIMPGKGVRYTAMVKAGKRLKDGSVTFRVYAVQGNNNIASNVSEFNVEASRR